MAYETILVETRGKVGLITLNRPEALNALSSKLLKEVMTVLRTFEADPKIGAIVITGSEKAFAAGADIKEMAAKNYVDMYMEDFFAGWEELGRIRKPIIAAVAGYALGGGCELAMMCDFIIAAESAKFGQPEITLGVMPGMGGSQRLARFVGKAKAMDMCLTGRMMDAAEAERAGLVARVVPAASLMDEAMALADKIAAQSLPIVMMAKESVNRAFETTLAAGSLIFGGTLDRMPELTIVLVHGGIVWAAAWAWWWVRGRRALADRVVVDVVPAVEFEPTVESIERHAARGTAAAHPIRTLKNAFDSGCSKRSRCKAARDAQASRRHQWHLRMPASTCAT